MKANEQDPARYYNYLRWMLELAVPAPGDGDGLRRYRVPIRRYERVSNPHNEADELNVEVDWLYAGLDVRLLSSAIGVLYVGREDPATGVWTPTDKDVRFIGVMKRPKRTGSESGLVVELLFHDYTAFFLETKGKFPSDGVPEYSDTLKTAWRRICEHTGSVNALDPSELLPTVGALADRIVFEGGAEGFADVIIGSAVPARFRAFAKVQVPARADAWAVWQICVGMLGLISFIRGDQCIVTTATDYYSETKPARLIWGHNIKSLTEDRDIAIAGKGVVVTSFSHATNTVIEGFWPPIGDASVRKKKVAAKKRANENAVLSAEDRIGFACPELGTQEAAERMARRIYEEFSRQDFEGRVVTDDPNVTDVDGDDVDILGLHDGDAIRIEVDRGDFEALGQFESTADKVTYLVDRRGYLEDVARIVVANLNGVLALPPLFIIKRVRETGETTEEGGSWSVEIAYCNKIQTGGGAT